MMLCRGMVLCRGMMLCRGIFYYGPYINKERLSAPSVWSTTGFVVVYLLIKSPAWSCPGRG